VLTMLVAEREALCYLLALASARQLRVISPPLNFP